MPNFTHTMLMTGGGGSSSLVMTIGALFHSQEVLLRGIFYGTVHSEGDVTQPFADFTQVKIFPKETPGGIAVGDSKYFFFDKTGNLINMAVATPAVANNNHFDPRTGRIARNGFAGFGTLVMHSIEGAALSQKNEELGRISNAIGSLANLVASTNSVKQSFIGAVR